MAYTAKSAGAAGSYRAKRGLDNSGGRIPPYICLPKNNYISKYKNECLTSIMNNILTLISIGKVAEATRYEILLNRLIEEGEVWELNNLLDITKKDIQRYKEN